MGKFVLYQYRLISDLYFEMSWFVLDCTCRRCCGSLVFHFVGERLLSVAASHSDSTDADTISARMICKAARSAPIRLGTNLLNIIMFDIDQMIDL